LSSNGCVCAGDSVCPEAEPATPPAYAERETVCSVCEAAARRRGSITGFCRVKTADSGTVTVCASAYPASVFSSLDESWGNGAARAGLIFACSNVCGSSSSCRINSSSRKSTNCVTPFQCKKVCFVKGFVAASLHRCQRHTARRTSLLGGPFPTGGAKCGQLFLVIQHQIQRTPQKIPCGHRSDAIFRGQG